MKFLVVVTALFLYLPTSYARQCVEFFTAEKPLSKESVIERLTQLKTVEEYLELNTYVAETYGEGQSLAAATRVFIESNIEFVKTLIDKHSLPIQALDSLRIVLINNDPRYQGDHLTFVAIADVAYYFSKKPSRIDPSHKEPGWYQVEPSQIGFMAREKKQIIFDEKMFLEIAPNGMISFVPRNLKDPLHLKELYFNEMLTAEQKPFVGEFMQELVEALETTPLTIKEILETRVDMAIVVETKQTVYLLPTSHGEYYFSKSAGILEAGKRKRWGLLGEESIGMLKGSDHEIVTSTGLHIKLKRGRGAEAFPVEAESHYEALLQNTEGHVKDFVTEFAVEIKSLLESHTLNVNDFFSQNLTLIKSNKTGEEFFALQKSEEEFIYFTKSPEASHSKAERWGYLSEIDTQKQGSQFTSGPTDLVIATPPGFVVKPIVKVSINHERLKAMQEQQQQRQQLAEQVKKAMSEKPQ